MSKLTAIKDVKRKDETEYGGGDEGGEVSCALQCPECGNCAFKILEDISLAICCNTDCDWVYDLSSDE